MKVIQLYALRLRFKSAKNRLPRGVKPFKISVEDPPEFKIQSVKSTPIIRTLD